MNALPNAKLSAIEQKDLSRGMGVDMTSKADMKRIDIDDEPTLVPSL